MSDVVVGTGATRPPGVGRRSPLLAKIASTLRSRPDSEHEMVINRLVISLLIAAYFIITLLLGQSVRGELQVAAVVYISLSVAFFVHIVARPQPSVPRRVLAILVDLGALSWGLHVGDEVMAVFYPIYLWVIFGNGFRLGLKYLFFATAVSVVGFSVVVATTDYWFSHLQLAIGLLIGLIVLPLYAATLIRKLSAARQQAEEASRAKTLFLASVSHELRTPLNAVIGFSDLLQDTLLDSEQRDMTRTIGTAGRSLLNLINSILDFSRIEAGSMPVNIVDFDLYALMADVRAMLAVQAQAKGLRLSFHITPRAPQWVRGDKRHLEEILVNLTANAVKFTETGYVTICVDAVERDGGKSRLRFEVVDTGIGIALEAQARIFESFTQADETIIDRFGGTGLGLAIVKQLVELLGGRIGVDSTPGSGSTFWFEIDVEEKAAASAEEPSMAGPLVLLTSDERAGERVDALGIDHRLARTPAEAVELLDALAKEGIRQRIAVVDERRMPTEAEAIALLGDDLARTPALVLLTDRAPEALPRGSRSIFVTTLAPEFDRAALTTALRIADRRQRLDERGGELKRLLSRNRRRLTILVAEDNRTNQKVIAKILERAGHDLQIVDNGEAALDALNEREFDLVFMDINMPVMNGLDATKLFRFASLGGKRVPIVALTADATAEVRVRCEEAGMDACVTKPVEPSRLLEVIDELVPPSAAEPRDAAASPSTVADISSHPRFRPGGATAIDVQTLDDLRELGGPGFVGELVTQFIGDAPAVLRDLAATVAGCDAQSFRDQIHALRSAAANVGAQGIYDLCLTWRQIGINELSSKGEEHVRRLKDEFERVGAAFREYLAEIDPNRAAETSEDAPRRLSVAVGDGH